MFIASQREPNFTPPPPPYVLNHVTRDPICVLCVLRPCASIAYPRPSLASPLRRQRHRPPPRGTPERPVTIAPPPPERAAKLCHTSGIRCLEGKYTYCCCAASLCAVVSWEEIGGAFAEIGAETIGSDVGYRVQSIIVLIIVTLTSHQPDDYLCNVIR